MSDYLPQPALIGILSRLPVESLLRFRCVCKSWCTLISEPDFIATHHSHSTPHLLIKYFSPNSKREHYSLFSDNNGNLKPSTLVQLKSPFKTSSINTFFRVVSTCNGLICLSDDHFSYTYTIILWNPAIRKSLSLPMPRVCVDSYGPYMFALGFGFDSCTHDYKVVRIAYIQSDAGYIAPPEVEVFAVSTGEWKDITAGVPPYKMVEYFYSSAFSNGVIHWLAYYHGEGGNRSYQNVIMGFDVATEVFRDVVLPTGLARDYPLKLAIGVYQGTISVFQYDDDYWAKSTKCSVWVMKQYGVVESWSKLFDVELPGLGVALGFRTNGELLLAKRNLELVSYKPKKKTAKKLRLQGSRDSVYAGTYAESLALLGGGQQVQSYDVATTDQEAAAASSAEARALADSIAKNSLLHHLFAVNFLNY